MATALAFINRANDATITASSSAPLMPPRRLIADPHVARKWRGSAGSTEYLTIDLQALYAISAVALFGLNLTAAGITRVRVSATDPTAIAGELYDSSAAAERVDPDYGTMVVL